MHALLARSCSLLFTIIVAVLITSSVSLTYNYNNGPAKEDATDPHKPLLSSHTGPESPNIVNEWRYYPSQNVEWQNKAKSKLRQFDDSAAWSATELRSQQNGNVFKNPPFKNNWRSHFNVKNAHQPARLFGQNRYAHKQQQIHIRTNGTISLGMQTSPKNGGKTFYPKSRARDMYTKKESFSKFFPSQIQSINQTTKNLDERNGETLKPAITEASDSFNRGFFKSRKTIDQVIYLDYDGFQGGKVTDKSGKGNDGIAEGQITFIQWGETCGRAAVKFTSGSIKFDTLKLKGIPKEAFTFMTWVRFDKDDRDSSIYSSAANDVHHHLHVATAGAPNGYLQWTYNKDNKNVFSVKTDNVIPSGIWTHVTASFNSQLGKVKLFVNGEKVLSEQGTKGDIKWGNSFVLGANVNQGNTVIGNLVGDLDETYLFSGAMDSVEVETLFKKCTYNPGETPYYVTVCTVDKIGAGTQSRVFIKLYGNQLQFGEVNLKTGFSRKCSSPIQIYAPNIGPLSKISIRKDTKGITSKDWHLEKIEIMVGDYSNGQGYQFVCNCWFKASDNTLQRYLSAEPRVDGQWSTWSLWSGCGAGMCGGNRKVRTKSCTNPFPIGGGAPCPGESFQTEDCPVDGGWGAWSTWSPCVKTCDGDQVVRTRVCDNPAPARGGKNCQGASQETKMDCTEPCQTLPVDGGWSQWTAWSACGQTCGGSVVMRNRSCTNPPVQRKGQDCPGSDSEIAEDCTNPCPVDGGWSEWSEWSDCSASCGPGVRTREHNCSNPYPAFGGKLCQGSATEEGKCTRRPCPNYVDGYWGQWGAWGACSETQYCYKGIKLRTRPCNNPAPQNGGSPCIGADTEETNCPKENCEPAPVPTDDQITPSPSSYLARACSESKVAYLAQGSHAKDVPQELYKTFFPGLAETLQSGYFSKVERVLSAGKVTKFCFEPKKFPIFAELLQQFPKLKDAAKPPHFELPKPIDRIEGIAISLKVDGTLYAGEFALSRALKYTAVASDHHSVTLEDVQFVYRETPGSSELVAYGKEQVANSTFDTEVIAGPEGPRIEGKSKNEARTEVIEFILSLIPTVPIPGLPSQLPSSISNPLQTFKEDIAKGILEILKRIGISNVPLQRVTDSLAIDKVDGTTRRLSGAVQASSGGAMFTFEAIKQKGLAAGFTTDKAMFAQITKTLFNKEINLFGNTRQTSIGIAFSTAKFGIKKGPLFTNEPLKTSLGSGPIPKGLYFSSRFQMPDACDNSFCELAKTIFGKETWFQFTGTIWTTSFKIAAAFFDRVIKDDLKFKKIEVFVEMEFGKSPKLGFSVDLSVPIGKGEIEENNQVKKDSALVLGGKMVFTGLAEIGTTLKMTGKWRKAFGISFLTIANIEVGFVITVAAGIPTEFNFKGRLELGNNCIKPDDFKEQGHCFSSEILLGVSANPLSQYIYGELSALTLGKIFRMLGSKIELPSPLDKTGFPEGLVISAAWKEQTIPYAGSTKTIKQGLFVKGKVNLLGFAPVLEININDKVIFVQTGFAPINLPGGVKILRSLAKDEKNGPMFSVKATRKPLGAQVLLQGAGTIFGIQTELLLNMTKERIQTELMLQIFAVKCKVSIYAGYPTAGKTSLSDASFGVKVELTSGMEELIKSAMQGLKNLLDQARKLLQGLREKLRDAKKRCREDVVGYCQSCQNMACETVTANCKDSLDKFKNYIGTKVDRAGRWIKNKFGKKENEEENLGARRRRRRNIASVSYPPSYREVLLHRRKRFVGRFVCEVLAPKACQGSQFLCKGSCNLQNHLTKGSCKLLDVAHQALWKLENSTYWAERAAQFVGTNLLVIHQLSFETHLSPTLDSTVGVSADVSVFGTRMQFSLDMNLKKLVDNAKKLADKAVQYLKKRLTARLTKAIYDPPSESNDVALTGPFQIKNKKSGDCISVQNLKVASALVMSACNDDRASWIYTLTGQLMNTESGLCAAVTSPYDLTEVTLENCDTDSKAQNFTCNEEQVKFEDTDLCWTETGGDRLVLVRKCGEEEIKASQDWLVNGDPRNNVCDKFVIDLALDKPATQSSTFVSSEPPNLKTGAELAVNGDMASQLTEGSCAQTAQQVDPWWKVDLLREYVITDVSVVSASGGPSAEPLSNFEIRVGVSQDIKLNPMCGERIAGTHDGEIWTSQCTPPLPGQFVSIHRIGDVILTVCEVAVYARQDNQGKCTADLKRKRRDILYY